ncbi:MAG: hypothetical protein RLZZ398_1187 [Verrucomicrobiota bacterium]
MIHFLQQRIARRFRAVLCGDASGNPPWIAAVAAGDGPGFFAPGDAPWIVHGDMATLVGGVRALLMQALHPATLAGVRDHSRYREDPLGRLAGTIQWLTVTTYASRESIFREAARVRGMHGKVRGTYRDSSGREREYTASEPELLRWVHIAFMESFLRCHQTYSPMPIPGGADAYIRLWARSVEPIGLSGAPADENALLDDIRRLEPQLAVTDECREVIEWLRHPPLPVVARIVYRLLFQAAYLTLPVSYQKMIGLRAMPRWLVVPTTRCLLRILRIAIGSENPIQDAAIARLNRQSPTSSFFSPKLDTVG